MKREGNLFCGLPQALGAWSAGLQAHKQKQSQRRCRAAPESVNDQKPDSRRAR